MFHNLKPIARELANYDPADHAAQVRRIDADVAVIDKRVDQARRELSEINAKLRDSREGEYDSSAIADAMLAGGDVLEAVASVDKLADQRAALQAGVLGLNNRRLTLQEERREAMAVIEGGVSNIMRKVGPVLERAMPGSSLEALASIYAGAEALRDAAHCGVAGGVAMRIREVLSVAARNGLIARQPIPVPGEVISMLRDAAAALALLGSRRAPEVVAFPL